MSLGIQDPWAIFQLKCACATVRAARGTTSRRARRRRRNDRRALFAPALEHRPLRRNGSVDRVGPNPVPIPGPVGNLGCYSRWRGLREGPFWRLARHPETPRHSRGKAGTRRKRNGLRQVSAMEVLSCRANRTPATRPGPTVHRAHLVSRSRPGAVGQSLTRLHRRQRSFAR